MKEQLIWNQESRKTVYTCPIFRIAESYCYSPEKELKTFTVIETSDWAIVIPLLETGEGEKFVMVRQWRHGAMDLSLEFPGGVFEKGEDAAEAAARELLEETGYQAGKIEKLGGFSPNPAIMSNRVHFFLAWELKAPIEQELDEDEFIEVVEMPKQEVLDNIGKPPYIHALMGTAISLYLQKKAGPLHE